MRVCVCIVYLSCVGHLRGDCYGSEVSVSFTDSLHDGYSLRTYSERVHCILHITTCVHTGTVTHIAQKSILSLPVNTVPSRQRSAAPTWNLLYLQ